MTDIQTEDESEYDRVFAEIEREEKMKIATHGDLVRALKDLIGWMPGRAAWHTDAPIEAVERARAALRKAGAL